MFIVSDLEAHSMFSLISRIPTCKVYSSLEIILKNGVVVVPGLSFGKKDGYVRISYSTATEKLEEAMERIKVFLR